MASRAFALLKQLTASGYSVLLPALPEEQDEEDDENDVEEVEYEDDPDLVQTWRVPSKETLLPRSRSRKADCTMTTSRLKKRIART